MNGKTFLEIWRELNSVDFGYNEDETPVLEKDFYGIEKGTSNLDIWSYLEDHFNGVVIGEVITNDNPNWKEDYGDIKFSE